MKTIFHTIIVWLLVFFYLFLLIIYLRPTKKPPFQKLSVHFPEYKYPSQACSESSECNNNEMCFQNKCYPTYRGTRHCNLKTGTWILIQVHDQQFLKCTCLYPRLITQRSDGGNCDVDLACGPYGRIRLMPNVQDSYCECTKGYKSVTYPKIQCTLLLPSEKTEPTCAENEMTVIEARGIYSLQYLNHLPHTVTCIKKPCSFNVLNGKPLKHAKWNKDYGCVCNPTYGHFGIRLENTETDYIETPGYNACASVFENEPTVPMHIKLFTYFYILGKPPVSFIQFPKLPLNQLVPEFKKTAPAGPYIPLQIEEMWPNNYMQYVFEHENYIVHTRDCWHDMKWIFYTCNEKIWKRKQMNHCHTVWWLAAKYAKNEHLHTYKLLYHNPVCKYKYFEGQSEEDKLMYDNRYILNPYFILHKNHPELVRSNGLQLYYNTDGEWEVSLAHTNFDRYEETSIVPYVPGNS